MAKRTNQDKSPKEKHTPTRAKSASPKRRNSSNSDVTPDPIQRLNMAVTIYKDQLDALKERRKYGKAMQEELLELFRNFQNAAEEIIRELSLRKVNIQQKNQEAQTAKELSGEQTQNISKYVTHEDLDKFARRILKGIKSENRKAPKKEENTRIEEEAQVKPQTYAARVKQHVLKPAQPVPIIIRTTEPISTTEEAKNIKKTVMTSLAPSTTGIRVRLVRGVKQGVLVRAADETSAKAIRESIELRQKGFETRVPKQRDPRIAITGIDRSMTHEEITAAVYEQNFRNRMTKEEFTKMFSLVFQIGRRKQSEQLGSPRMARNQYVALMRKNKREQWRITATVDAQSNPWGKVYKIARGRIKRKTAPEINLQTIPEVNECVAAEETLKKFLPEDDPKQDTIIHRSVRFMVRTQPDTDIEDIAPFTATNIKQAIWKSNPKKAPGRDGITPTSLRISWDTMSQEYISLFNLCYRSGIFPTIWKEGEMRLIPKKNGGVRPLTLLSVVGKTYEHLIRDLLEQHLEEKSPLHCEQYGFRIGKSTVDAIMSAVRYVSECPEKYVCGLFLDIKGAFDHAWWPTILRRLKESHAPNNLQRVIHNYFKERRTYITGRNFEKARTAERGCPQGSVLGPTFWGIIMDTFLGLNFPFPTRAIAYADDGLVIFSGRSRAELDSRARVIGATLDTWAGSQKLEICGNKTVSLMLRGKFQAGRQPLRLHIGGSRIRMVESLCYLGVTISEGLSFKQHVRNSIRTARDAIYQFRRYSGNAWGYNFHNLRCIYKGIFEGILAYATPVWAHLLQQKTVRAAVLRGQRAALLLVTKAFHRGTARGGRSHAG
ncbi:UNVERIFIED_CONTAM: hypothetical protein PYX00_002606 [Menopon gallinae]|uniref:Reverse transcriptase domain-containing protein n=1 Tax=Menopon gallinae TaxID=328185 RepID=A0AAW2HX97_9NEOP